ncbi:acetyltransferase [Paraburkholderia phytofirmans]|jgi:sugar O-acyltransferase (sialic acid O-acetyltransferase NeuD family)|uniref:acetyltransferase n=1 Tax=Paraburkholderia phytofirmans TaxID=261302 RepID=UPI0038BD6E33
MEKTRDLVIVGDSAFAEVAYEYFTHDSEYNVVAFVVESEFMTRDRLFDLPVVPLERLEELYPPERVDFYAAIVYSQLNRLRARLYETCKAKGYKPASYISSKAFVWPNASIGEHCFIFENNTVQPFVRIEDNVVLWSGNHIGHHTKVDSHCFISSQVVISGFCTIGRHTFMGVNSTVSNNVNIGESNWIGPGVSISSDTEPDKLYGGVKSEPARVSARRFFKVRAD